jgi:protein HEXIM1/2
MADPLVADDAISSTRELEEENQHDDSLLDHDDSGREVEEGSTSSSDGDGHRTGSDDEARQRRRHRQRRVKGGKRHHRKYKPYHILSQEEKQKLAEKESLKAHLRRASLLASGHPLAPYNTTQYLIEEKMKNGQIALPASPKSPMVQQQSSRPMTPNHPPCATPRHPGITDDDMPLPTPPTFNSSDDLYPELNTPASGSATPTSKYDEEFVQDYDSLITDRFLTMTRAELLQTALGLQKQCDKMGQTLRQEQQQRKLLAQAIAAAAILDEASSSPSVNDDGAAVGNASGAGRDVIETNFTIDVGVDLSDIGSSNTGSMETTATTA